MANPPQAGAPGAPGAPAPQPAFRNLRRAPAQPPVNPWQPDARSAICHLWGFIIRVLYRECPAHATQQPFPLEGWTFSEILTTENARVLLEAILDIVATERRPDDAAVDTDPWLGAFNPIRWRQLGRGLPERWSYVLLHMWWVLLVCHASSALCLT